MTTLWSHLDPAVKAPAPVPRYSLRSYQAEAYNGIVEAFTEFQSALCVLPTGTGKTVLFSELARKTEGRVLIITHRDELNEQAANKIYDICGERPDIEKAQRWANELNPARIVIASVQSLYANLGEGIRAERFDPAAFALVIVDEAHHYVAPKWVQPIRHFLKSERTKVLGVTATPNRSDEVALGKVFQTTAYIYEARDAQRDGWLVYEDSYIKEIESLDLSWISTASGDFNRRELEEELIKPGNLTGMVPEVLKCAEDRKTLVFGHTKKHVELLTNVFNGLKPNCAQFVVDDTPSDIRKQMFRDFAANKFQVLVNCGIVTEGVDIPDIEVVALGRPTKSVPLLCQMLGRGLRPLSGVVDGISTADARKAAILASRKPRCLVLDFCGVMGKTKIARIVDALGGNYDDEVLARADQAIKEKSKEQVPADVAEELERAKAAVEQERREKQERLAKLKEIRTQTRTRKVNVFDAMDVLGIRPGENSRGWDSGKELSPRMAALLERNGIKTDGLSYGDAKAAVKKIIGRMEHGWSSVNQMKLLARHGIDASGMRFADASAAIDAIKKNGWKVPAAMRPLQQSGSQTHASPAANTTDVPW